MATGNSGSKGRMGVLVVLLVVAVAVAGWYKFGRGGGGGIDQMLMAGELFGKSVEEATKALGVEPVPQTNPDPNSTATIYLYTITNSDPAKIKRVSVQVRANKITRADLVDEAGKVIPFESKN